MAGTLELTEALCWMPPGYIFDPILRGAAEIVAAEDDRLSHVLLNSQTEINGGYLDLRDAEPGTLRRFATALVQLKARFVAAGPHALVMPDAYEAIIGNIDELLSMLNSTIGDRGR